LAFSYLFEIAISRNDLYSIFASVNATLATKEEKDFVTSTPEDDADDAVDDDVDEDVVALRSMQL
jgi:hypothetical protein